MESGEKPNSSSEGENLLSEARGQLLPEKSKSRYLITYNHFITWKNTKWINKPVTEDTFLAYFQDLSKCKAPSTLWSTYSMLKKMLRLKEKIDISLYKDLTDLLKVMARGFESKKAKVLSPQDVEKFLTEAPDDQHLATKAILIFGVQGACRREELYNVKLSDILDTGSMYNVKIPRTKTYIQRTFVIEGQMYEIVKKYANLRPDAMQSDHFFINFQNGKCVRQVIGLNKIGAMPHKIATYLQLDEPRLYTGHCFRRTSATVLADSGADLTVLKRHGGWKSNQVAEGYIEDSLQGKRRVGKRISDSILKSSSIPQKQSRDLNVGASTSKNFADVSKKENVNPSSDSSRSNTIHITNCTVNFYQTSKD